MNQHRILKVLRFLAIVLLVVWVIWLVNRYGFVSYGVGLTQAPWLKFAPALIISIAISNPPIVALGAGLLEGGKLLLGLALLGVFGLEIVTGLVQRQQPNH